MSVFHLRHRGRLFGPPFEFRIRLAVIADQKQTRTRRSRQTWPSQKR
jgi:hypothetical protein